MKKKRKKKYKDIKKKEEEEEKKNSYMSNAFSRPDLCLVEMIPCAAPATE